MKYIVKYIQCLFMYDMYVPYARGMYIIRMNNYEMVLKAISSNVFFLAYCDDCFLFNKNMLLVQRHNVER